MPYKDPAKKNARAREYYRENHEEKKADQRAYGKRTFPAGSTAAKEKGAGQRAARREKFLEYFKDHPCETCGERDRDVLVFHHVNPKDKSFSIQHATRSWTSILEEMQKCVVLCANCHLRVHAMMRSFGL
jgi:hypothetical protein